MIASCSKFLAQIPMMKPKRLNAIEVSPKNAIIQNGWSMRTGTLCEACAAQLLASVDSPTFKAIAQLGRYVRRVVTDGLKG